MSRSKSKMCCKCNDNPVEKSHMCYKCYEDLCTCGYCGSDRCWGECQETETQDELEVQAEQAEQPV
jgi:hypothetical protein